MNTKSKLNGREFTPFGLTSLISCHIGWGITDVCIAYIGRGQVLTWIHTLMGSVFIFLVLKLLKQKLSFKEFLHSFPYGITKAIAWGATFYALQQDNPAIVVTILSFSLVLSIIIYGPLLGEKTTPHILLIAFMGAIGVFLVANKTMTEISFSKGALIALCVLPFSVSAVFILRNVQRKVSPIASGLYMYLWVAIIYTFIIPFINPKFEFTSFETFVLIILMVFGGGGHILFGVSQKLTTFRINQITSIIQAPATAFFSWIFLDKLLKGHQIIGMFIVIGVVAYMSRYSHRKAVKASLENQMQTM